MQLVFAQMRVFRQRVCMGSFGSKTLKPSLLYANSCDVVSFNRPPPASGLSHDACTARRAVDGFGDVRVSGGPDLKSTQAYTAEFALATLKFWEEAARFTHPDASGPCDVQDDPWHDAVLVEVFKAMN